MKPTRAALLDRLHLGDEDAGAMSADLDAAQREIANLRHEASERRALIRQMDAVSRARSEEIRQLQRERRWLREDIDRLRPFVLRGLIAVLRSRGAP